MFAKGFQCFYSVVSCEMLMCFVKCCLLFCDVSSDFYKMLELFGRCFVKSCALFCTAGGSGDILFLSQDGLRKSVSVIFNQSFLSGEAVKSDTERRFRLVIWLLFTDCRVTQWSPPLHLSINVGVFFLNEL